MGPKSLNDELDEQLDDTFPASDPPSLTGPAGDARKRQKEEKAEDSEPE